MKAKTPSAWVNSLTPSTKDTSQRRGRLASALPEKWPSQINYNLKSNNFLDNGEFNVLAVIVQCSIVEAPDMTWLW